MCARRRAHDEPGHSEWRGRAHAAQRTLPRRSAGARDAVRNEVSQGASEKYLVACRVVASRRAGSGGIEGIAAKRLQEEIGQWQRVADAVKAA